MNKFLLPSILCLTALSTGCDKDTQSDAALSQSAHKKPSVAVVPLIDNSEHNLSWSLSDEFTYTLCSKLVQRETLDIALPDRLRAQTRKIRGQSNPFGDDLAWVKQAFSKEDFVVFLELVEHDEVLNNTANTQALETLSAQLKICMRLRIVDLRGDTPKITLQEIFQDSHFIPRQFTSFNFNQMSWNAEEFNLTPMGIAHAQMIKDIRTRVEEYILIAAGQSL